MRAIETGSIRWMTLVGVLIGFAFLAKTLQAFLDDHGGRAVVKTPRGGYDGHGVRVVSSGAEAEEWLAAHPALLAPPRPSPSMTSSRRGQRHKPLTLATMRCAGRIRKKRDGQRTGPVAVRLRDEPDVFDVFYTAVQDLSTSPAKRGTRVEWSGSYDESAEVTGWCR